MSTTYNGVPSLKVHDKQTTTGLVYQLASQAGPISRIELAELAHLAPASITKISRQLIACGLLHEVNAQQSTGGRRPINLQTRTDNHQIVAVRIGRTTLHTGLCDLSGSVLASREVPLNASNGEQLVARITDEISTLLAQHKDPDKDLMAIAMTSPGLVNTLAGIVHYLPHINLAEPLALTEQISKVFHVPSYLGNNIRALALAEHYFGCAKDCQDVIVVRLHNGIGAGIIIDGAVLLGQAQNRGEIGHIQVNPLGERCHCGNFGCLETIASNKAIVQRVQQLFESGYSTSLNPDNLTVSTVCDAANQGDELAIRVLTDVAENLAKALATTINLLNPQEIVIGGHITEAWGVIKPVLEATLQRQTMASFIKDLPIEASKIERHSLLAPFALIRRALNKGHLLQYMIDQIHGQPTP
ncbi:ROK family transcriptional regulator [Neiella marina]|uniref:ROK family transcriptional regulator n=1 Tax=Neiella holothuriorum TaxID=2870530 RepID=A0ABS7EFJ8_9GAMM|nr:ROK family protein [Neiella holothuriorum]MBW8190462.1 ROK family transcriptional regulator [Neiella holothuriorum]